MRNGCDDFGIVKKAPKGDTAWKYIAKAGVSRI